VRILRLCLRRYGGVAPRGRLFLPQALHTEMEAEGRRWTPKETGGMLLGYRSREVAEADIVVCCLVSAGPEAKRMPNRFEPDGVWQQERLEKVYEESGRTHTYIGDWHTHPRGGIRPSKTDRDTFARVAAHTETGTRHPVVLIIGLSSIEAKAEAYVMSEDHPHPLSIVRMP
jgi:integrative and conjugative element protein (TIGR02256 family)